MASNDELACIYSALILADDDVQITDDKINTILNAAGVSVEPFWPTLFAKAVQGMNIRDLVSNVGSGGGGAAAPAAADAGGAPAAEEKKEEKKEESSEEEDDDMGFGLFD
ncbi:unnamed protein product [Owenia fusiformis]|uniref:Large ribosomal subunit protein P1 n=1 Tax=Owenia fusiformis TaxID=6347 RepID=A0A8J1Y0L2_OWEFU|nr:unnamed protein product [Owenia fusiformis]